MTFDGTGSTNYSGPASAPLDVFGSEGDDHVAAGIGSQNDFAGGADDDTFIGGPNTERFHMEAGNDTFDGAGGSGDFASYETAASVDGARLNLSLAGPQDTVGFGIDQVVNVENVVGSNGPDVLTGTSGPNILFGGNGGQDTGDDVLEGLGGADQLIARAGDDVLNGGPDNDTLFGEAGTDTASFALGSTGPVAFSLDFALTGVAQVTGGAGSDTLADSNLGGDPNANHEVEDLIGSPFADTLTGNTAANRIDALDGLADTIDCVDSIDADVGVGDEVGVDAFSNCESVDTAPQTQVSSGPANGAPLNDRNPVYGLNADEPSTFQYRVDGGPFQACAASCSVTGLADGGHTISFRAVDADENGNADQTPATRTVTIDATPPQTSLVKLKKKHGPDVKGRYKLSFRLGSSEPGSTFACTVDGKPRPCTARFTVKLRSGQAPVHRSRDRRARQPRCVPGVEQDEDQGRAEAVDRRAAIGSGHGPAVRGEGDLPGASLLAGDPRLLPEGRSSSGRPQASSPR